MESKEWIENGKYGQERAFYNACGLRLRNCSFEGEEDGESALKESCDVEAVQCRFLLRYPMWHAKKLFVDQCTLAPTCRAALWYTEDAEITGSKLGGIKAVRECRNVRLKDCEIDSEEFGWKCSDILLDHSRINSEYLFLDSRNITLKNVEMKGKYSFQYVENLTIEDSVLDTKDAFWHAKNVTVRNSVVKGEYLGWFSEGLTLINCRIIGTQPLCYCEHLTLSDCTMEATDLSFEYSDVEADVKGEILSVKNPRSGHIVCDRIGELVLEDSVMECSCEIEQRLHS